MSNVTAMKRLHQKQKKSIHKILIIQQKIKRKPKRYYKRNYKSMHDAVSEKFLKKKRRQEGKH